MIRCADIQPLLSDYADGVADERGRRIVERHIQLCRACRDGVLVARQLGQQLVRLPLLPMGVSNRAPRMRGRLEQKLLRPRYLDPRWLVRHAIIATLVGVLGILLWLLVVNVGL